MRAPHEPGRADPWSAAPPLRLAALGAALGLFAGIAEVSGLAAAKFGLGRFLHVTPQIVWMAPASYAAAFATIGAAAGALATRRPQIALRVTLGCALFLGGLGILFRAQSVHKGAWVLVAAGIAAQGSRLLAARPRLLTLGVRWGLPAAAVTVAASAIALNLRLAPEPDPAGPAPAGAPNVLLIVWDTVRARNLSAYGATRRTTPVLERLAAEGALFENAMAPAPWTLPSHASMFTGLRAHELRAGWERPLEEGPPTLAESLRSRGWRTGAFVANTYYAGREAGLARGFGTYRDHPLVSPGDLVVGTSLVRSLVLLPPWRRALGMPSDPGRRWAPEVEDEFLTWLDDSPRRPFFAFLNFYDAHDPYLPPPPFDTAFGPLLEGRDPVMEEGRTFSERDLAAEIDAYDGSIAWLDHRLGLLVDALASRGVLDDTMLIVTSDHGEEFGEHGVFTHGNSLYHDALHVPLVVRLPGRVPAGVRVRSWVTTADVAATVQDVCGLGGAADGVRGAPLTRHWREANGAPDAVVASVRHARGHLPRYPVAKGDMGASMSAPWKLILNGDGTEEIYDLVSDPQERHPLPAERVGDRIDVLRGAAPAR